MNRFCKLSFMNSTAGLRVRQLLQSVSRIDHSWAKRPKQSLAESRQSSLKAARLSLPSSPELNSFSVSTMGHLLEDPRGDSRPHTLRPAKKEEEA
jgi:hypothetical protein